MWTLNLYNADYEGCHHLLTAHTEHLVSFQEEQRIGRMGLRLPLNVSGHTSENKNNPREATHNLTPQSVRFEASTGNVHRRSMLE